MRRLAIAGLVGLWGCGARGEQGGPKPQTPAPVARPEPPSPLPPPRVGPRPQPPLPMRIVRPPEPEPEPEPAELVKPWPDRWEPRILAVQPVVAEAAAEHGVDPHLVNAVIWVESKFDRKARNRSGARGLMQLMPKTAKSLGRALGRPARIYDARFNVHAGTYYLSRLLDKFDGDEALALASYVRGPSRVRAWVDEGQPFPDGVQGFVDKVQQARAVFVALGWPEPPSDADTGGSAKVSGDDDAPTSAAPR